MALLYKQGRMRVLVFAAAIGIISIASPLVAAESIVVYPDHDLVVKRPANVATIVLGNPQIANITPLSGDLMVITAKSFGTTNLVMLDRSGKVLLDRLIEVHEDPDEGSDYRGGMRIP